VVAALLEPGADGPALLRSLVPAVRRRRTREDAPGALRATLAATPAGDRPAVVTDVVRAAAATVAGLSSPDGVPSGRDFTQLGFDSLMALELRNRLTAETGVRLSTTAVFDHPTPAALAGHVLDGLPLEDAPAAGPNPLDAALSRVEDLLRDGADGHRAAAASRLRVLLARLDSAPDAGIADDTDHAGDTGGTVEDLLQIIGDEFGIR
jgi:polyketide synthase 12